MGGTIQKMRNFHSFNFPALVAKFLLKQGVFQQRARSKSQKTYCKTDVFVAHDNLEFLPTYTVGLGPVFIILAVR